MSRKILFLTMFCMLLPAFLLAQTTTGRIKGKVTDRQTGEPLVGANVQVVGTTSGAATDVNGDYEIRNLQPAVYSLKASFIGYTAITLNNVRVNAGLTTEGNIPLPAEGVTVGTVEVTAVRPLINKSNTNAVRITTSEDIQALPVRGVNNILSLTAGVTIQNNAVFIRGGRLDEVGYYLEGVSITNPVTGGRAVTINQDALEEVQVQAGGYTAEFGGANSGIIRTQLKTGPQNLKVTAEYITDNVGFQPKSKGYSGDKRLGAYWFGYNEFTGTLGGPVLDERFRFFGLFNYNYQRDANPQPYPGISLGRVSDGLSGDTINLSYPAGAVLGNQNQTFDYSATFTMDFKPILIRFAGTYSSNWRQNAFNTNRNAGNVSNLLDVGRIEQRDLKDGSASIKLTHVLSNAAYYELNAGYFSQYAHTYDPFLKDNLLGYGDSVANANAGFVWQRKPGDPTGRFIRPARLTYWDFSFNAPGDVTAGYQKANRQNYTLSGALTYNIGKVHAFKIGGEFQRYTIRNYSIGNEGGFALAGQIAQNAALPDTDPQKRTLEQIFINQGINNYGYDALGNETNASGVYAPKHPVFAGAYVQDRIEFRDLILNLGVRFDYINTDNKGLADMARPELTFNYNTGEIYPQGLVDVPKFTSISPRIGLSFPVTDQTVFHAQFGKFVQQTRLADIYQGLPLTYINLRGGFFITNPVGFNVRPTRTTQYELGFSQQIADFASFDITGYYKDIVDQVVYDQQIVAQGSPFKNYYILRNGDFATTKGVEITFNMRRTAGFAVNASLSFQDARGTGSFPNSNRGIVGAPLEGSTPFAPAYISPLEFNNPLSGNVNVDFRFGPEEGPAILHEFGISALARFTSGHPYTLGVGGQDLEGDARDRQPIEPLNSSSTPATFQVDLKVDKTIRLFDALSANIYIFVINLFDRRNVENVFLRTGTTTDNGVLSNPNLSGDLSTRPGYADVYRAININYYEQYQTASNQLVTFPYFYGPPRQIRLGIRLEY
ncbi:MAG: TonB-dependent receptor [Ignavibacteria bacterium]|nr:TonB-dependent receptor [Ignavibacteria bacterium]MCU7519759.1 TonB-dependent receptor [Ignavibacteria bacterium]